ncbi:hypothetical protein SK128_004322 [Halocaridina rubra]|uniref:Uncharacterized protein n=1 Tax=Halocaridina rubra TaxID=373956 RepID=A0AAN8WL36_HALRR
MGSVKLIIFAVMTAVATFSEGRPQEGVQASGVQPSLTGTAAASQPPFMQGLRELLSDVLRTGTSGVRNFNTAFSETALGTLQGVRDTVGATNTFVQNSARAGGELAKGAVTSSMDVSRDAVGATGEFWRGVSQSVNRNVKATADATANFADAYINEVGNFANAANDVARRVLIGGIENYTQQRE